MCLNCASGSGRLKLTNNILYKNLKFIRITRNLRTTLKLLELSK